MCTENWASWDAGRAVRADYAAGFATLTYSDRKMTLNRRRPCRFGKKVPAELKQLVEDCWAPSYDARPDFNAVCDRLEAAQKGLPPDKRKGCTVM